MAPCFAGSKCPLALPMVHYDPAAASKRARHDEEEADKAAGLVPHHVAATAPPPLHDVEPINAVSRQRPRPRSPPTARKEPECLRKHVLLELGLRVDLPVHFIDEKLVTRTDLNGRHNRFRIPNDGVLRRLRAILTPAELDSANLLHDPPPDPRPKPKKKRKRQPQPEPAGQETGAASAVAEREEQQGKKIQALQSIFVN